MPRKPKTKKPAELRANRLILEDLDGQPRLALDAARKDAVFLDMYGSGGASLSLAIDSDGNPKITFVNKAGHAVLGIGVSDEFGQGFSISDSQGRPVCFVFAGTDDIPRIHLMEHATAAAGQTLWASPEPDATPVKRKPAGKKRRK